MARKAPKVGDVVKSRVTTESLAGYIVAKEGIHVWVRFFDNGFEASTFKREIGISSFYCDRQVVRI